MGKYLLFIALFPFLFVSAYINYGNQSQKKGSTSAELIIQKPAEEPKCTDCHSDLLDKTTKHAPVAESCDGCHAVNMKDHTENGVKGLHLADAFPKGFYSAAVKDSFALCWSCHDSQLLTAEKTTTATHFRNGDRNLHFVHINGSKGRTCIVCHNVHSSNNKHLINDAVKFGDWNLPIKYTSKDNGGSCFPGCHAKKDYTY